MRFSLRALMLFVLVAAVGSWWYTRFVQHTVRVDVLPDGSQLRTRERVVFVDGQRHTVAAGAVVLIGPDGRIACRGEKHGDTWTGDWTLYDAHGRRILAGPAEAGTRTGTWTAWHDGNTVTTTHRRPVHVDLLFGADSGIHAPKRIDRVVPVRRGLTTVCGPNGRRTERTFVDDELPEPWTRPSADEATLRQLGRQLRATDARQRDTALERLTALGGPGAKVLAAAAEECDGTACWLALESLGDIGPAASAALPTLRRLASRGDGYTRYKAHLALALVDESHAATHLNSALDEAVGFEMERLIAGINELQQLAPRLQPVLCAAVSSDVVLRRRLAFHVVSGFAQQNELSIDSTHPDLSRKTTLYKTLREKFAEWQSHGDPYIAENSARFIGPNPTPLP